MSEDVSKNDADIFTEITEEAARIGNGKGECLDALLCNIESGAEVARGGDWYDDTPDATETAERRSTLLSIAAWALMAIRRHDAAPTASIEDDREEPAS